MTATSNANTSGLYLLMKRGLYYRPDAMGYTGIKDHAGRYSKEDAEDHSDPASGVTMVSEAEAAEFSPNCFDDLARAHLLKQRDAAEARAHRLAKALETLDDERRRDGVNLAHLKRAVAVACADTARAEAQDEGAAGELKPCPFCGGPAKMIETMGEWVGKGKGVDGGAYGPPNHRVVCAALYESPIRPCSGRASPSTEQKAIAAWNARAHPSPTPAADADRVRIAVEAFNAKINAPLTGPTHGAWDRGRIAGLKEALAALKSTAAKEGGE